MNLLPWSWGTEKFFSRPSWQPFKRHPATWDACPQRMVGILGSVVYHLMDLEILGICLRGIYQ